jgi:hypothetical protein
MAHREIKPNPELDALVDDCVDLRIKINLAMDAEKRDDAHLHEMVRKLAVLEQQIEKHRRYP